MAERRAWESDGQGLLLWGTWGSGWIPSGNSGVKGLWVAHPTHSVLPGAASPETNLELRIQVSLPGEGAAGTYPYVGVEAGDLGSEHGQAGPDAGPG